MGGLYFSALVVWLNVAASRNEVTVHQLHT